MKIVDKWEPQMMDFGEILSGDVFYRNSGYYIKIDCDCCNAVYLKSGFTLTLDDDTSVRKVNATLIIEGEEE